MNTAVEDPVPISGLLNPTGMLRIGGMALPRDVAVAQLEDPGLGGLLSSRSPKPVQYAGGP